MVRVEGYQHGLHTLRPEGMIKYLESGATLEENSGHQEPWPSGYNRTAAVDATQTG